MALYYQLSTQNVLTKFLSVSSITGGNSVNASQLASTTASLLQTSVIPPFISTQGLIADTLVVSSITASSINTGILSSLTIYASSLIGIATGGLAVLPSTISSFSLLTSSILFSTATGNVVSTQQLFASSILAPQILTSSLTTSQLFTSTATISTFSTNSINFAGGFGFLTLPDIYPNTVYTSTVTTSNLLLGVSSQVSPIQFYGFGSYSNSVIAELSTGNTTQELLMFRGSNTGDRLRLQTTGNIVFESGVSARIWPTVNSNVVPSMVINTLSNVGIQTANPTNALDVAGTGRFIGLQASSMTASTLSISSLGFISSLTVNSLQWGDGTGWVSFGPLQTVVLSTTQVNTNLLYASNSFFGIQSTVTALQFFGLQGAYTNTALAEISTGAGTQELLMFKGSSTSDRIRMQTTGSIVFEPGVSARLWSLSTIATQSNATPAMIINTSSNVGIQTASPGATLDVAGTARALTLSSLALNISSINGVVFVPGITTTDLQSTVGGLGQIYPSTGGGGGGGISAANLASTVVGLGSAGYLSSIPSVLSTSAFFTSSAVISTATVNVINTSTITTNAMTLGTSPTWIFTSPIQNLALSTNSLWADAAYINTNTVTTEVVSTLTTNALTLGSGATWIQTAPLQTSIVSSIYMFANQPYFDTVNVGSVSTLNTIQFFGLTSNFNNTVLAEISTGGGSEEFLVFKGSTTSDRVRIQTTGNFVVETGVSARLWNSNTLQTLSNATPAFIINTSSNVGIQTSNPGATLDVAGTGRFLTLSSQQIFTSSIVAPYTFASQFITF